MENTYELEMLKDIKQNEFSSTQYTRVSDKEKKSMRLTWITICVGMCSGSRYEHSIQVFWKT